MKRVAVLLGLAAATPSVALAQLPVAPASPPSAAPAESPAASPALAPAPAPTPTQPAPAADGTPPSPEATPHPNEPASGQGEAPDSKRPPGDQYYVEPAPPAPPKASAGQPRPFEPPPPPPPYFEVPPPPELPHVAPYHSLWLGARLGWFFPFGSLWARTHQVAPSGGSAYVLESVPWRNYAASGPMFELDAGARLSRAYTLFGLWERAQLGSGRVNDGPDGAQDGAESDFWAVGLRASSDPDDLGFLTEVAIGYRRARTFFKNDVQYQFTDAPFEARLGLGAEWRVSRLLSLSALATIGVGGFGSVEAVAPNGQSVSLTHSGDQGDGHAWATLTLGSHFDLLPSRK